MLRIYPDVRVRLHAEAEREEEHMNILVALVVGYVIGAKTGGKDLDRLGRSLKALCGTDEFADVVVGGTSPGREHACGNWRALVDGEHDDARHRRATWSPGSGTWWARTDSAPVRSVTSWPIPRNPTAVPAEPTVGWART